MPRPSTAEALAATLRGAGYLPGHGLAVAVHLALRMGRPLLLEGEAGVGKTEVARAVSRALGLELIRLQCYEGIDADEALYEWDYPRQLLQARLVQSGQQSPAESVGSLYREEFLLERPLLRAVRAGDRAVLLIDELDRADDEFEAFLLEALSDFTLTIPQLGTIRAASPPVVVITSNRTRDLHDALKRRCLYHWVDLPGLEREVEVIRLHVPEAPERLARSVAARVRELRGLGLTKSPGVAEAIDWARALALVGAEQASGAAARDTLGWVVKNREDLDETLERVPLDEAPRPEVT